MSELLRGIESDNDLNKWQQDLGGEIIGQEKYNFIPRPVIVGLPQGQKWTSANLAKRSELAAIADRYKRLGLRNNTVLTLQAFSIHHRGFGEGHSDRLFGEGNADLAFKVDAGNSQEIHLALGTCSYYEHLAWFRGDVKDLENPNGVLVSLQTITNDDKLAYLLRDHVSTGSKKIGIVGGTLDYPTEVHVPKPEDIAYEEIVEELGVGKGHIEAVRLLTLLEDRHHRPVLFYRARLRLTGKALEEIVLKNLDVNKEHSKLYLVDNTSEGLFKFAREHSPDEFHAPADLIFQHALMQAISKELQKPIDYEDRIMAGTTSF